MGSGWWCVLRMRLLCCCCVSCWMVVECGVIYMVGISVFGINRIFGVWDMVWIGCCWIVISMLWVVWWMCG